MMKNSNATVISHHVLRIGTSLWLLLLVSTLVLCSPAGATPNQQLPDESPDVFLPIVVKSGGTVSEPPPAACVPPAVGTVVVGQDPYGSASDETNEVFVANHQAGTISVLQGTTVVDTITGLAQPYDVAYNPSNNLIYVTDEATGELVIIDPQTHAIIKRLGGLDRPRGVGIDRNTGTAYVSSPGTEGVGAVRAYSKSDVDTNSEGTLITSVGVGPSWVAVDPETHQAYVTLQGEMNYGLAVIDGAGGGYAVTYVGLNTPGAFGVAYNGDNQRLYVASGTASILSVVDVTKVGSPSNPVIAALKTNPEYNLDTVAVNPATGHVFVTGRRELNAKVWVLDGSTNTWLDDPFNVGSYNPDDPFLRGVSFDPVRGWFYVSSDFTDQVYVFDDCGD